MRVMVTGGAGYIGAHVVRALQSSGQEVSVLDDLSTGDAKRLTDDIPFRCGSILDADFVAKALDELRVECVVHVAAKKAVEESVANPLGYYRENVIGLHTLLTAMARVGVRKILFSSSAAVYGLPSDAIVTEDAATVPESPYGWTKLFCEQIIRDAARAETISWASLRYFNVAGAMAPELGDRGNNNLIPKVFRAITDGVNPKIFGQDYPTRDGTCIRDYVHVGDIADAHAAVTLRMEHDELAATYNIGTGQGTSVLEVLLAAKRITGVDFCWDYCERRPGDPATVVADATKIRTELGWRSNYDLDDIIESAWQAWPTK